MARTIEQEMKAAGRGLTKARADLAGATNAAYAAAVAAFEQEVPSVQIADTIGITTKTLYSWLRDAGVYPRP